MKTNVHFFTVKFGIRVFLRKSVEKIQF